jgi:hypothetical protein
MSKIVSQSPLYFPKRKPAKKADYLSFLHSLPCVVTGRHGVEAAHVSFAAPEYLHYGRGKGTKADDRWALPLSPEAHRDQHSHNERDWWARQGIDPHLLALVIYGAWSAMGDDAEPFCIARINQIHFGRNRP